MIVYTLQLEHGKWYVGTTQDLQKRVTQHKNGMGAVWTRKYKPMNVVCTTETENESECKRLESVRTAELMWKHGVNAVRGAELCDGRLFTIEDRSRLVQHIGHILNKPYDLVRQKITPQLHVQTCNTSRDTCFRCGRNGHWVQSCYATWHANGRRIESDDSNSDVADDDGSNSDVADDDGSNSDVADDDGSNSDLSCDDGSNSDLSCDDGSNSDLSCDDDEY
jgi:predicted GIY-YIG superfamily endonuclease